MKRFDQLLPIIAAGIFLGGCVHEATTQPDGPGGAVLGVTSTGLIFTQSGHDLWLREGVPANYFSKVGPGKWYISEIDWHAGNTIRLQRANPTK